MQLLSSKCYFAGSIQLHIMGNNMCLSENQAMLCSEKQTETLTLTSYNSGSPYPQRNQLVDQIYQQLIRDKPLTYSVEQHKHNFLNSQISIFGESGAYIGDKLKGKPHGAGQLYFFNQNFLEATFNQGEIDAEDAILIENNGNYYRGGFKESVQTGSGILKAAGSEWRGEFSSGRISGSGKLESQDGSQYVGSFQGGKMGGKGKLVYANGDVYEGYFKEGQLHGIGYFKAASYEYYGPFRADRKEGKGTLLFAQGGKFEGWFQRDQIHGYGEYHAKNGQISRKNHHRQAIVSFTG